MPVRLYGQSLSTEFSGKTPRSTYTVRQPVCRLNNMILFRLWTVLRRWMNKPARSSHHKFTYLAKSVYSFCFLIRTATYMATIVSPTIWSVNPAYASP